jgi:hypothetical protein
MLGRLEMDIDECIGAYSDLAAAVFGEKLSSIPVNIKGEIKARFDSAKLENAIQKVVSISVRVWWGGRRRSAPRTNINLLQLFIFSPSPSLPQKIEMEQHFRIPLSLSSCDRAVVVICQN